MQPDHFERSMASKPKRQRSAARGRFEAPPADCDLEKVAENAVFIGDSQHKDIPFFVGTPFERQPLPRRNERGNASLCPHEFQNQQERLTQLLQDAIRKGQCEGPWKQNFPQFVWVRIDQTDLRVFKARHSANGKYKGWPEIVRESWPEEWQ
jgi:hypothetical protein